MTNSEVFLPGSAEKLVRPGGRKHIHLFKQSLAETHLFVAEDAASEGVIEWPAASDPVKGLHTIEMLATKLGLK